MHKLAVRHVPKPASGPEGNRQIDFPRLYDLLIFLMTRARERAFRRDVLDRAGLAPGRHVLDVGCGTGTQAIAAWRRVQPGGSVVGVDLSDRMLAAARRKADRSGADILFRKADAADLPFEDRRFDVVAITLALHMVPPQRRRAALAEAARVLRCGGRVLLVDYAGDPADRKHSSARHGLHRAFNLHDLRGPLAEAGFDEIDGGPLEWLSLHALWGRRRGAQTETAKPAKGPV